MENLTFKLYSPLTAELLPVDSEFCQEDELVELRGHELSAYAAAISEQIEREGDHLEQYLNGESEPYLTDHVKSIRLSVEEHGGELCGCAAVVVDADLTERGWNDLQEYLSGQYSDGWGEGFEQRDIAVEDGSLNVHFWQPERFAFTVEQGVTEPQEALGEANTSQQTQPPQPAKKYEITDIAHPVYPELHRIRALREVSGDVAYGTLGVLCRAKPTCPKVRMTHGFTRTPSAGTKPISAAAHSCMIGLWHRTWRWSAAAAPCTTTPLPATMRSLRVVASATRPLYVAMRASVKMPLPTSRRW